MLIQSGPAPALPRSSRPAPPPPVRPSTVVATAEKAYRMGNKFDHQNGEESSARFMVGVAAALNPAKRHFALVYPQ